MHRASFVDESEVGWRAAGAIQRENEGPTWMRRHIITMRVLNFPAESQESAYSLRERPAHQMM